MRYRIDFSYDGTNFKGYQKQPNLRTVENCINNAVSYLNGKETFIYAAGRTDKGVHALNQVAHFDLDKDIPIDKIKRGLNSNLDGDIHIISVKKVSNNFNARFNVKRKEYIYKINMNEYNPMDRNYIYQYNKELDITSMNIAIKYLIGKHDFTSFVSSEDIRENKVRIIYDASITVKKNYVEISFIGNGFMKYQVRNMVGLLISVGEGKKDCNILEIINNKNRSQHFKTAPACGLYLKRVMYK